MTYSSFFTVEFPKRVLYRGYLCMLSSHSFPNKLKLLWPKDFGQLKFFSLIVLAYHAVSNPLLKTLFNCIIYIYIYIYPWVSMLYSINWHNSINQVYSNKNLKTCIRVWVVVGIMGLSMKYNPKKDLRTFYSIVLQRDRCPSHHVQGIHS